jgi:hypothetical protein
MIGSLGIHPPLIEQVPGYQHEVDPPPDRVPLDHFTPGAKEVQRPIGQIVTMYAQMNVSYVKEFRHLLVFLEPGLSGELTSTRTPATAEDHSHGRTQFQGPGCT